MKTILCFGDSNTYGYNPETGGRYAKDERWPGVLAALLGDEYTLIEEGCNGRTTMFDDPFDEAVNGLKYLKPCLKSHKPLDAVILMLGTNDLKRYLELDAKDIAAAAGKLVQIIKDYCFDIQGFSPEVVLISPPQLGDNIQVSPFYPDFDERSLAESKKFSAEFGKEANRQLCSFYDAKDAEISTLDQLHLTRNGHKALAEGLCGAIRKLSE